MRDDSVDPLTVVLVGFLWLLVALTAWPDCKDEISFYAPLAMLAIAVLVPIKAGTLRYISAVYVVVVGVATDAHDQNMLLALGLAALLILWPERRRS